MPTEEYSLEGFKARQRELDEVDRKEKEKQSELRRRRQMQKDAAERKKRGDDLFGGRVVDASQGVPLNELGKWVDRDKAAEYQKKKANLIKDKVTDQSPMMEIGHQVRGAAETIKDLPEIAKSAYKAAYLKTGRAVASLTQATGDTFGYLDDEAQGNLAAITRTMSDMERVEAPLTNKGMEEDSFRWAFETTARAVPELALGTLFTVATTPAGGAAYFGAMQAGETYDQTLQSMLAKGHSMEEAQAAAKRASAAAGAVTAGTSMVTGRAIAGRVLPAGVQQKIGGSAAGRLMASKPAQYGEAMLSEAAQEAVESGGVDISRALAEGDKKILEGMGGRMTEAAVAGAMFGGVMESMGSTIHGAQKAKFNYEIGLAKRGSEAAGEAARIMGEDGGEAKLRALGAKTNPSRKDFIEAGFNPDLRLNRKQRQQVAEMFHPDNLDTAQRLKQDIDQQKEAARQQGGDVQAEGVTGEPMMSTGQPVAPEALTEEAGEARLSRIADAINRSRTEGILSSVGKAIDETFDSPVYRKTKELAKKGHAAVFKSRGLLNEDAFQTTMQRDFDIKSEAKRTEFAMNDFTRAIKKEYGDTDFDKIPEQDRIYIRDALKGDRDALHKLKDETRKTIETMRGRIDKLSEELATRGVIEGELEVLMGDQFMDKMFEKAGVPAPQRRKHADPEGRILGGQGMDTRLEALSQIREAIKSGEPNAEAEATDFLIRAGVKKDAAKLITTVIANDGIYLHRSYRAFDDPDWSHKVDPAVRNRAKNWLRSQYKGLEEGKANQIIDEMLYNAKEDANPIRFMASQASAGRGALMQRKDLPKQLRELLGEYESPEINYAKTVRNLSSMIANHKMMNELRSLGLEHGFMSKDDPKTGNPDHVVSFGPEMGGVYSPLRGMRTTPEVKAAIDGMQQGMRQLRWDNKIYNWYQHFEGFSQRAKTSLSFQAMFRQIPSNMLIALSNGQNPTAFARHGLDMIRDSQKLGGGAWRDRILEGVEYGVIGENVDMNVIADKTNRDLMLETFESMTAPGKNKFPIFSKIAKLGKRMDRLYSGMDTVFKMAAWEIETARYAEAQGIDMETASDAEVAALRKKTASIVRDTNPTYSMIPHFFKEMKRMPIASFISFQTEVIRNQANIAMLAMKEMSSDNPKMRAIGYKRAVGWTAAKAIMLAPMYAARYLTGLSSEDDDALAVLGPEYLKHTMRVATQKKGDSVTFADVGFIDPVSFAHKSLSALWHGANPKEKAFEAVAEFIQPYTSSKLLFKYAQEANLGYTEKGRELYSETDSQLDRWGKGAWHIMRKAMVPGTINSTERLVKASMDRRGPGNIEYGVAGEALSAVGIPRTYTINVPSSIERATYRFSKAARANTSNFKRALNREGMQIPGELERAYNSMRADRRKLFDDMQEKIEAARQLTPDIDIESILSSAGLSEDGAKSMSDGVFEPWIPSTLEHMNKMLEFATPEDAIRIQEAKAAKLQAMAYSATGPGLSEDSAEAAQDSIAQLEKHKIPKDEVFQHLADRFLAQDRREDVKELKEIAKKNGLQLTEDEFKELAEGRVVKPKWTQARRERVRRINWYREE